MWEQAGHVFGEDGVTPDDIRVTVDRCDQPAAVKPEPRPNPGPPGDSKAGELLARLGRLLSRSSGRMADVALHLETRAVDLDDDAREDLRDDALALHDELATLTSLLEPVDCDGRARIHALSSTVPARKLWWREHASTRREHEDGDRRRHRSESTCERHRRQQHARVERAAECIGRQHTPERQERRYHEQIRRRPGRVGDRRLGHVHACGDNENRPDSLALERLLDRRARDGLGTSSTLWPWDSTGATQTTLAIPLALGGMYTAGPAHSTRRWSNGTVINVTLGNLVGGVLGSSPETGGTLK